ncbi:MAG: JAB domain-containing protein [Eubacteriales bacterium]|nr:JAB domain-containing protein [Eubacteriales bacterium]
MPKNNPFELDRVTIRMVRDNGGPLLSNTPLDTPTKVAKLLYDEIFADLDREIFAVINLKSNLAVAGMKVLAVDSDQKLRNMYPSSVNICSMGSLNESIVHPREVLKSSILSNANAVLLAHFHPSGKLEPSREDIQVTDRLIQAYDLMGISVVDHVILGPQEQYYSFHENDILPLPENRYTTMLDDIKFPDQRVAEPKSALERLKDAREESGRKKAEAKEPKRTSKKKIQEEAL